MWETVLGAIIGSLIAGAMALIGVGMTHFMQRRQSQEDRHADSQLEMGHRYLAASLAVMQLNSWEGLRKEVLQLQISALEALFEVEASVAKLLQTSRNIRTETLMERRRKELWEWMPLVMHLELQRVKGSEAMRVKAPQDPLDNLEVLAHRLMNEGNAVLMTAGGRTKVPDEKQPPPTILRKPISGSG